MMFTFKTEKSTGKWRSFYNDTHYIKLKKKKVGQISCEAPYKISLMVYKDDLNEDGSPNCEWKWIRLKKENQSLQEAKDWLNERFKILIEKYRLYLID